MDFRILTSSYLWPCSAVSLADLSLLLATHTLAPPCMTLAWLLISFLLCIQADLGLSLDHVSEPDGSLHLPLAKHLHSHHTSLSSGCYPADCQPRFFPGVPPLPLATALISLISATWLQAPVLLFAPCLCIHTQGCLKQSCKGSPPHLASNQGKWHYLSYVYVISVISVFNIEEFSSKWLCMGERMSLLNCL